MKYHCKSDKQNWKHRYYMCPQKNYHHMKNKNILSIIIIILCTLLGHYQVAAQTTNEFTVPLSDPSKRGTLKAHLNSGSITIKGTSRKDVLIRYKVDEDDEGKNHNKSNTSDSKAGLKRISGGGIDLEVTEHQNNVKAESGSWTKRMNLEIEIPSNFDLKVHTYNNGFVMVTNVQGAVELTNYNGKITALNITGSVIANTFNGEIKVTFDKVAENTPMSFTTYNGDVDLTFPSNYKASLKTKTEQGSIYSDFDVQFKSTGPIQKKDTKGGVYKVVVDEWKQGDINGGGPEVTLRNYNGDIIVRKK